MKEIPNELTINGEVYVRQTTAKEPESKPWPQEGDEIHVCMVNGTLSMTHYDPNDEWLEGCLKQGRLHRTEAEAIRANEVEAANAAIKRWRDENAPFVADWSDEGQDKHYSAYDYDPDEGWTIHWTHIEIPNVIYFASRADLARCQSELPDAWAALVGVK